ncbi:MAG: sigma-54 dependent transcriptional regulator [Myxococcota bacterium]
MGAQRTILVADDEANLRKVLAATLRKEGYEVLTAADGAEALQLLDRDRVDVLLTDLRMPRIDGMELLNRALETHPSLPVVILTAHGTVETAKTAMKRGAFDYLEKPFDRDELRVIISKAAATAALNTEEPEPSSDHRFGMIGRSRALEDVFKTIEKVAASPSTVLITGESGTGKELIAAALHHQSPRAAKPLIKINCAAIPRDLIESELFGYERGAFTGAVGSKPGRFELADGGTLFLDEIGEIPPEMQVKLLRALQEHEFERVGGVATTKVDVRLIAATNQNLEEEARLGRFREDLYYRLAVVPIALPPLRERKDDIPLLVDHFVEKYNRRLGKSLVGLTDDAMACLMNYAWPGNIRELENVMERGVLFAEGARLGVDELPATLRRPPEPTRGLGKRESGVVTPVGPLKEIVKQHTESLERDLINRALEATGGNVTKAAEKLDISRKTLQNKMKDLKLRGADGDEAGGKES